MLRSLRISNFALIDDLELELAQGLIVFTGETGAGKSIILDALSLLVGERASSGFIRSDSSRAYVEGLFDIAGDPRVLSILEAHGLEPDEDGLLIAREISREGRNRCFVNGRSTVVGVLREMGELLVDIHGQHDHQRLLSPSNHLAILDSFGDRAFAEFRAECSARVAELKRLTRELEDFESHAEQRRERIRDLEILIQDVEALSPRQGEDDEVSRELRLLSRSEEVRQELLALLRLLGEEEEGTPLIHLLSRGRSTLEGIAADAPELSDASRSLSEAYYLLQEVQSGLRGYLQVFHHDPERIQYLSDRLGALDTLKRRYGPTLDDVLSAREEAEEQLAGMRDIGGDIEEKRRQRDLLASELRGRLHELSRRRGKLASLLEEAVTLEVRGLGLEGARFEVSLDSVPWPDGSEGMRFVPARDGLDRCEMLVTTNPGEPLAPLRMVASGGELSRLTLGLKSCLANLESVPIMVFDEIDAGIGGQTAHNVADRLVAVSKRAQCLCITHLAQIAARGDVQFHVEKSVVQGRTQVAVRRLGRKARVDEVARMLGGVSAASRKMARELLSTSGERACTTRRQDRSE